MATVSDLIHSSARLIGAIAAGETLETNELDDALVSLNQMLSSWNTEGASLVGRSRIPLALNVTNGPYPLTPPRPVRIESASVAVAGIDCPLELVDSAGWEAITEKGQLAILAKKLYCDYQYPQSNVYIWPVPRSGGTLELWVYTVLAQFTSLSQVIDLPPGYEAAVRYNLAVELAPEYGRPLDPAVPALAQQFKASLVQLNAGNHMRSMTQAPVQTAAADAAEQAVAR